MKTDRIVDRTRPRWFGSGLLVTAGLFLIALVYAPTLAVGFYYDDALQLYDARQVLNDPGYAFGGGSFGRFRPLRLLNLAAVYLWAGPETPLAYHALSLVLHGINVWLFAGLLRRLLRPPTLVVGGRNRGWVVAGATAVFACHWAGSEAVTYVSAVGVLWTTLGGLIAARAVVDAGRSPTTRRLGFTLGMVVAVGGGEYWLMWPAVWGLLLAWPGRTRGRRGGDRWVLAGLTVSGLIAYAALHAWRVEAALEGQTKSDWTAVGRLLVELLSRNAFPGGLIDERWGLVVVSGAVAPLLFVGSTRRFATSRGGVLLGLLAVVSVLPYAFNALVPGGRFNYVSAGFAWAWLLSLVGAAAGGRSRPEPGWLGLCLPAMVCLALAMHVVFLYERVGDVRPRAESLTELVSAVRAVPAGVRAERLTVRIDRDVEHAAVYLDLLGVLPRERVEVGSGGDRLKTAPGAMRMEVEHAGRAGYVVRATNVIAPAEAR